MKSLNKLFYAVVCTIAVIITASLAIPPADTYRIVHGVTATGATYTATFRDKHPSPLVAFAQVQNARGQNAGLVYESQSLGAATTATAASVGAAANDTLTWGIPFPDTNYQVACTPDGTATAIPAKGWITKTATAVVVNHIAGTAAAASNASPGFDCVAIHQ